MNMSKKIINNYPRQNNDWQYINYLEDKIKELKEENKQLKEGRCVLIKKNTKLSNDLFWSDEELEQSDHIINLLKKENAQLKEDKHILSNKILYYKQSLL